MVSDDTHDYPIDGELDLHQFAPNETREVVIEYLLECRRRSINSIRIVHGKGKGVQRKIVMSVLKQHPDVLAFRHEGGSGGGWGGNSGRSED